MRLLDRYLLRELLVPLGYCLGGFLIFYVAFDLIFQINRFLEAHLLFLDIVEYYIVTLPDLLVEQVLPAVVAAGVALHDNQSQPLQRIDGHARSRSQSVAVVRPLLWGRLDIWGGGLSHRRILAALIRSTGQIHPGKPPNQKQVPRDQARSSLVDFYNRSLTGRDWNISRFMISAPVRNPRSSINQQITRWPHSHDAGRAARQAHDNGQWLLYNAVTWQHLPGQSPESSPTNAMLALTLPETPEWLRSEIKFNSLHGADAAKGPQVSMREITDYLRLHPQINADKKAMLLTQWQKQLAAPFTYLAVVLIALPFGTQANGHNVLCGEFTSSIFHLFQLFILQRIVCAQRAGRYLAAHFGRLAAQHRMRRHGLGPAGASCVKRHSAKIPLFAEVRVEQGEGFEETSHFRFLHFPARAWPSTS